jgi:hypothetical protein
MYVGCVPPPGSDTSYRAHWPSLPRSEASVFEARRIAKAASPAEVEKTVRELCAFGTRHVLSRTDSASEGTGAARSSAVAMPRKVSPN